MDIIPFHKQCSVNASSTGSFSFRTSMYSPGCTSLEIKVVSTILRQKFRLHHDHTVEIEQKESHPDPIQVRTGDLQCVRLT